MNLFPECWCFFDVRMNRGRTPSMVDHDWQRRRSITPNRSVQDLVQSFETSQEPRSSSSSSSSSSSEDEQPRVEVIVERRERPRKSSLVRPGRPRVKKQSNVSFANVSSSLGRGFEPWTLASLSDTTIYKPNPFLNLWLNNSLVVFACKFDFYRLGFDPELGLRYLCSNYLKQSILKSSRVLV